VASCWCGGLLAGGAANLDVGGRLLAILREYATETLAIRGRVNVREVEFTVPERDRAERLLFPGQLHLDPLWNLHPPILARAYEDWGEPGHAASSWTV
jgi:hypothetical protein